jgi:ABC-2 type transport system ATP-binding protein
VLGLVHPDAGGATVLGRTYRELERPLHQVGAVLEASEVHPGRSGRNHLRVLAAASGVPRSRVEEVLALVELTAAAKRRVKGYSLGMRQRLGLATALLGDPEVLVLDEPANGLDPAGVRWLRDLLRSLAGEGRTILVSSHVLAEVAQTVDRVVIIHRGKLIQQATIAEVLAGAQGGTRVRSPEASRLRSLLAAQGATVTELEDTTLVADLAPERIGELAAANNIVLHELTIERATLEEVFLELTGGETTQ